MSGLHREGEIQNSEINSLHSVACELIANVPSLNAATLTLTLAPQSGPREISYPDRTRTFTTPSSGRGEFLFTYAYGFALTTSSPSQLEAAQGLHGLAAQGLQGLHALHVFASITGSGKASGLDATLTVSTLVTPSVTRLDTIAAGSGLRPFLIIDFICSS